MTLQRSQNKNFSSFRTIMRRRQRRTNQPKLSKEVIKARKKVKYEVAETLFEIQLGNKDLSHKQKYTNTAQIEIIRNATATMPSLNETMIKCELKRIKKKRR